MMIRRSSGAFTGGALGALLGWFNIWWMGATGVSYRLGIGMRPGFSAPWVYKWMIWGGIWMLPLLLPVWKGRIAARGMLFSLAPSAALLLVVFPAMGKGLFGMGYGAMMPVAVVVLNSISGIFASFWYSQTK